MRRILVTMLVVLAGALSAQSYVGAWSSQAYSNTVLSSPTVLTMADDTISAEQTPAGFSVDFFGMTCDRFRVGSNGYITLGNAANPPSTVTGWTPDLTQGGMVIAALWLDLEGDDVVFKYNPGSAGGPGVLVVRWGPVMTRTLHPSSGPFQQAPGAVLFELQLDTATGVVTFRYGYPNWHCPEPTGLIHSQCIAGPSGAGQEVICQPIANIFSADGEMLQYIYDREITFTPAAPALMVTDGAPVAHGQAASGTQRDFGGQDVNAGPTAARTITLGNSGTGGLTINGISLSGANPALFTLDTSMTASSVAAGAYTTFEIAFDPDTVGAKTAQVEITHNDAGQPTPFTFEVAGTGMPTSIFPVLTVRENNATGAIIGNGAVAAGNRDFGSHTIGAMPAMAATIYVENSGTVALALGAITCNSSHFTLDTTGMPASLAPGASATFEIRFDAQSAGVQSATLTFTHDDVTTATPFVINVTGTAAGTGSSGSGSGGGGGGCTAAAGGGGLWLLGLLAMARRRRYARHR
jgi:hypothetical protein